MISQISGATPPRFDSNVTILQVLPALKSGGVERGTIEVAEAIVSAGGRAIVASEGGRMVPELERIGAETVRLPLASKNPWRIWRNAAALTDLTNRHKVTIIHARSRAPAWSAYWASRLAKVPFLTTYHGVYNEGLPLKRYYNSVMARGDRVIAISEFVARHITARHHISHDRITVIPRGADLRRFSPQRVTHEDEANLRKKWRLHAAGDQKIIVLPGRLTRWKGQTLFLEALAKLSHREDFKALIVGGEKGGDRLSNGPFETELRSQIAQAGLSEKAVLTGPTDIMPVALSLSDFVVSASLDPEAFGRVAVEAQAMGKPVIASDHGGTTETVDPGVTGWLFKPGDSNALAQAIENALDTPSEKYEKMASAAGDRVKEKFSVASMTAATLKVYEKLLTDASHSSGLLRSPAARVA
jgi:glycosyltransferase involved in cell wall biosynthesis